MENEVFQPILDSDETIIKELKPNKTRFLVIQIIVLFLCFFGVGIGCLIGAISENITYGTSPESGFVPLLSVSIVFIVIGILSIVSVIVTYQKTYYAITNKRVIIRSGFIGADYRALDLASIGAVDVKVDFLDKLVKPKETGTIMFGSMSMPINNANGAVPPFAFKHIDEPYDLYREIKTTINNKKNVI